jgi:hypothetical protein
LELLQVVTAESAPSMGRDGLPAKKVQHVACSLALHNEFKKQQAIPF